MHTPLSVCMLYGKLRTDQGEGISLCSEENIESQRLGNLRINTDSINDKSHDFGHVTETFWALAKMKINACHQESLKYCTEDCLWAWHKAGAHYMYAEINFAGCHFMWMDIGGVKKPLPV